MNSKFKTFFTQENIKKKLKAPFTSPIRENIIAVTAIIGVGAAVVAVYQTRDQLEQNQEQLDIAKEQIAVPQFVEAVKLLEKDSFLSKKSAINMLENLAITNQNYTQQSIDVLLSLNEWMSQKMRHTEINIFNYSTIEEYSKMDKQEKDIRNKQIAISKISNDKNVIKKFNTIRYKHKVSKESLKSIAKIITNKNVQKSNKLRKLNLSNSNLCGIRLADFNTKGAISFDFSNSCFIGARLSSVDFYNVNLAGVDFRNSSLKHVYFDDSSNVSGAKFLNTRHKQIDCNKIKSKPLTGQNVLITYDGLILENVTINKKQCTQINKKQCTQINKKQCTQINTLTSEYDKPVKSHRFHKNQQP